MTRLTTPSLLVSAMLLVVSGCAIGGADTVETADLCARPGEVQQGELPHDGESRDYRLYLPRKASTEVVPLVVALHGGLGTGERLATQSGLDAKAEKYGFAVVYPDGIWRSWNAGSCCGRAAKTKVDDVGFIRKLVAELGSQSCIKDGKAFATGFSNGAMLSHRLACEAPELLQAIAPVAGGPMFKGCAKPKPVPALFIVGRLDEHIPWDGGVYRDTYRPSIAEQVQSFAARNGCDDGETELSGGASMCKGLRGCRKGEVQWCIVGGVGHQWPGGQTILKGMLGPNNERVDAAELVMRFFAQIR